MPRIVKERTARRNEILDVAQGLVFDHGYDQMTIQEILDRLQISKGAFYHHFESKEGLLEALLERMIDEVELVARPIVDDPTMPALEKLQRFFDRVSRWKMERKEYMLAILRVWYADENALVRQKFKAKRLQRAADWLVAIVQQGIDEGVLAPPFPDQVGGLILTIMESMGDAVAELLLSPDGSVDDLPRLERTIAAYTDALEAVLRAPEGRLHMADAESLKGWVVATGEPA